MGWSLARSLGVVVVVAGCALQSAPKGDDAVVEARAKERWQALVAGDVPKAYEFLSPGSKTVYSLELYRSGIRPGFWKAVDVEKVECSGDICVVSTQVSYVYNGMTIKTPAKESWIREKGVWWYLHKS
jgi:hypothetical protein